MPSSFDKYQFHLEQAVHQVSILRQTIERRFPPDETIDNALESLSIEITVLCRTYKPQLNKEK